MGPLTTQYNHFSTAASAEDGWSHGLGKRKCSIAVTAAQGGSQMAVVPLIIIGLSSAVGKNGSQWNDKFPVSSNKQQQMSVCLFAFLRIVY